MSADKNKQNLRYQKVCSRINKKVRYDGFTKDEVILIKTQKQYEQVQKELSKFWSTAPRTESNQVNWDAIDINILDYFEYIQKQSEKLLKKISKLEDKGLEIDKIMNMFMMLNCNSVNY